MISQISDIMDKSFETVSVLDCVSSIKDSALKKGIKLFVVIDDNNIAGAITPKELISAHPNRIAADAMTADYICVSPDMPIWEARSIIKNKKTGLLLINTDGKIEGFITESTLETEFGKYKDLLTGLYKNEYIYYQAYELIKEKKNISFIFIDINNFGYIDKQFGHVVGDTILKDIAYLLNQSKPNGTYLSRYGGDEFLILAPYQPEKAKKAAEDLLRIVSSRSFYDNIDISLSAGIAGGQISQTKTNNIHSEVLNLINTASLACSEAKKKIDNLCVRQAITINDIA